MMDGIDVREIFDVDDAEQRADELRNK